MRIQYCKSKSGFLRSAARWNGANVVFHGPPVSATLTPSASSFAI
jgi:hypothetical protein